MIAPGGISRELLYNPEAEQYVLGAILNDNQVCHRVATLIRPEDFGNALHFRIFAEIGKLIAEGHRADPVLLKPFFDQDDALKSNGGGTYLVVLAAAAKPRPRRNCRVGASSSARAKFSCIGLVDGGSHG